MRILCVSSHEGVNTTEKLSECKSNRASKIEREQGLSSETRGAAPANHIRYFSN